MDQVTTAMTTGSHGSICLQALILVGALENDPIDNTQTSPRLGHDLFHPGEVVAILLVREVVEAHREDVESASGGES